uniref:Ribosomal eL28/Mak16 domain-containing protein n=1 Tax=Oryza punctata TaxID=4537 RepID=A0A0E0L561_ORYPU
MATVPEPLIWEIVKKNNCFLVKQFGNGNAKVQFTKEPNNLYNVHSYKHSGLANKKTVTIQPSGAKDTAVVLSTTKTKKQNAPAKLYHKSVMRKEFRKMAKAVKNQVSDNYYRPDLTKPALARLSSVYRSLQVSKSGPKKKNRQPTKLGLLVLNVSSYLCPKRCLTERYAVSPSLCAFSYKVSVRSGATRRPTASSCRPLLPQNPTMAPPSTGNANGVPSAAPNGPYSLRLVLNASDLITGAPPCATAA